MNIALWITTSLIAAVFAFSGIVKSTQPRARLVATGQRGITPFPMALVRAVAICELLGVVGLFVPWLSDTARVLTPTAAVGLGIVMYGAAISHASLKEPRQTGAVVGLLVLCAFVAAGRFAQL